jgi:hypothetical protein
MRPRDVRDAVSIRLRAAGWFVRRQVKVESRGTADGYRGIMDMVAHPPRAPGAPLVLPDPVLVEFDAVSVEKRTLAKLARYEGRTAGVLIVLTGASAHPPITGVDEVLTLA